MAGVVALAMIAIGGFGWLGVFVPFLILIASGSEVSLARDAARLLRVKGVRVRVVSMPSWDVFDSQPEEYRASVLPRSVKRRLAVEAPVHDLELAAVQAVEVGVHASVVGS